MARQRPLSDIQSRFVQEYLIDLNATQAAIRAGYSPKTANSQVGRLLVNVGIASAIREAMDRRAARTQVTADRVIREFARIAFAHMKTFAAWSNSTLTLTDSENLSSDDDAAVCEVVQSVNQFGKNIKIKLHDKNKALEKLGDHLGLWKKDPTELLEIFLASLPDSVARSIRDGIRQQVSSGGGNGSCTIPRRHEGGESAPE
jgi:phage terminase small subunit